MTTVKELEQKGTKLRNEISSLGISIEEPIETPAWVIPASIVSFFLWGVMDDRRRNPIYLIVIFTGTLIFMNTYLFNNSSAAPTMSLLGLNTTTVP